MSRAQEILRTTAPLLNDQKLKLMLFAFNIRGGLVMSNAEGVIDTDWDANVRLAKMADDAGIEALIPVCRWKSPTGRTHGIDSSSFETFTWAAGLAAETKHTMVVATAHVPTLHPVIAAKQCVTVDHISSGRFALNIVAGWFADELQLFGVNMLDHEHRYEQAAEWLEVLKLLWTVDGEFDFDGKYYQLRRAAALPKPIQKPYPTIVNAGLSPTGAQFCAQYSDVLFAGFDDANTATVVVDRLRTLCRGQFNRDPKIFTSAIVVSRPTEKETRDYLRYCVEEKGDVEGVEMYLRNPSRARVYDELPPEEQRRLREAWIIGKTSYQLVGTPEQVVDRCVELSSAGLDGISLSFFDYEEGLAHFNREIMPLLVQAGLRHDFQPPVPT